jgi:hypothetical protein
MELTMKSATVRRLRTMGTAACAILLGFAPARAADVTIQTTDNAVAIVAANPPGTHFIFASGTHYIQSRIVPKTDQWFLGEPGAIIDGSVPITGWTFDGSRWVSTGNSYPTTFYSTALCDGEFYPLGQGCKYANDLFLDGVALLQADTLVGVEPGRWYFNHAASTIYMADDPTGRETRLSLASGAILATDTGTTGVVIWNLKIQRTAIGPQGGSLRVFSGGLVELCDVSGAHGWGIEVGYGAAARLNTVHHNGLGGIKVYGPGCLLESNEIHDNNTMRFAFGWECGGMKAIGAATTATVRNNDVHDNWGPGLWGDGTAGILYDSNEVTHNAHWGIVDEISRNSRIVHNIASHNGWRYVNESSTDYGGNWIADIALMNSADVEVDSNYVNNITANPIMYIHDWNRYLADPSQPRLQNVYTHGNFVSIRMGYVGVISVQGDQNYWQTGNLVYQGNHYFDFALHPTPWRWVGLNDFAGWQAWGHDTEGTLGPTGIVSPYFGEELLTFSASPNPAPGGSVAFAIEATAGQPARLSIYDVTGRLVAVPLNGPSQGCARWDASEAAAGVYFAVLESPLGTRTTKFTVIR